MLNEATLNNFISVTFKLLPVTIPEKKLANTIRFKMDPVKRTQEKTRFIS